MSYVFYSILCLGMVAGIYLSQDVGYPGDEFIYEEEKEDTEYQDLEVTQNPQYAKNCYTENMYCTNEMHFHLPKPICVYKKAKGLVNFEGLCAIKLQYCLNKQLEQNGLKVVDEIYHNGKSFDCHYYLNDAESEKQAVNWYFILGGRYAQIESITEVPFN